MMFHSTLREKVSQYLEKFGYNVEFNQKRYFSYDIECINKDPFPDLSILISKEDGCFDIEIQPNGKSKNENIANFINNLFKLKGISRFTKVKYEIFTGWWEGEGDVENIPDDIRLFEVGCYYTCKDYDFIRISVDLDIKNMSLWTRIHFALFYYKIDYTEKLVLRYINQILENWFSN
jgi:hypothetical protein